MTKRVITYNGRTPDARDEEKGGAQKKVGGEELKLFLEASKLAIGNGGKFLINW